MIPEYCSRTAKKKKGAFGWQAEKNHDSEKKEYKSRRTINAEIQQLARDEMVSKEDSVIVSPHTKMQEPLARKYAKKLRCKARRNNIMSPIKKLSSLFREIRKDMEEGTLVAERARDVGSFS